MKIKEVSAGVKVSRNYDSYQAGLVAEVEVGENPEKVGESLMEKALEIVNHKMMEKGILEKFPGEEVGAAWFGKGSNENLSVQYSKSGKFEEVDLKSLEKIDGGYRQNINGNVFIFRRIPEGKRKNNKMPVFRVYRIEDSKI